MKLALLMLMLVLASNAASNVLYDEGIALVSGESWHLHQGYSITLGGVDMAGSLVWLDIAQNSTVVESGAVAMGTFLAIYRNENGFVSVNGAVEDIAGFEQESTATKVLQIEVVDVYSGTYHDMVLLKVTQYLDPSLPLSAPVESPSPSTTNTTPDSFQPVSEGSGWGYVFAGMIVVLVLILLVRRLK
ncbi:MAG: S-layer protein domain-containing protein [Methermicoccaceae archaeon]